MTMVSRVLAMIEATPGHTFVHNEFNNQLLDNKISRVPRFEARLYRKELPLFVTISTYLVMRCC
jgi:hypothetical protein